MIDFFLSDEQTVRHFTCVISFNNTCSFNNTYSFNSTLKGWMAVILYITQNAGKNFFNFALWMSAQFTG